MCANSKLPTNDGEMTASFATRDITTGEEITFYYNSDFECRTRISRHRKLRFECHCKACLVRTLFQQLSDMRRTLFRGLQYLTLVVDVIRPGQSSTSLIILESGLKKAVEDFSISISARLIYNLLVMCLLEAEGLLDNFMMERLKPGILKTASWFCTESNTRIAKLAMAQETWAGSFGWLSTFTDEKIRLMISSPRGWECNKELPWCVKLAGFLRAAVLLGANPS